MARRRQRPARPAERPARAADGEARRRDPRAGARPGSALRPLRRPASRPRSTLLAERGVPVAHCPRSNALLGCGIAPLAELRAAGVTVGPRNGLAGLGAVVRHVRGGAHRDRRRAGARAAHRRAARRRRTAARDARRRAGSATRRARWVPLSPESAPTWPSCRWRGARTTRSRIPPRPSSLAARRSECSRRSSTAGPDTEARNEDRSGKRHTAPQAPPARECSQRSGSRTRGGDRGASRSRSRRSGRRSSSSRACASTPSGCSCCSPSPSRSGSWSSASARARPVISDALQNAFNFGSSGTSISSLEKKVAKHPEQRTGLARPRHGVRDEAADPERDQRARAVHGAAAQGHRCPERAWPPSTPRSSRRTTPTTRTPSRPTRRPTPSSQFQPARHDAVRQGVRIDQRARRARSTPPSTTRRRRTSRNLSQNLSSDEQLTVSTYQRLAKLTPKDATTQLQLGQYAEAAGQHRRRDRCLQEVPEARADGCGGADGPEAS